MATCPLCRRGSLRIIAAITHESVIPRILRHLKLASVPPPRAPARLRQELVAFDEAYTSVGPEATCASRRCILLLRAVKCRVKSSSPSFSETSVARPPPSHTRATPSSRLLGHLSSPRQPCHALLCVAVARRGGMRGTLASAQGVFRGCASEGTAIT
jgi:hypothetical protein